MQAIKLNSGVAKYHAELGKAYTAAPLLAVTRGINDSVNLAECLKLADDELNQAIQCDPSQIESYLVLGEVYMYMGKKQKAVDAFQIAANMPTTSFFDGIFLKSYAKRRLKYLEKGGSDQHQPQIAKGCIEQAIVYRNEGNSLKGSSFPRMMLTYPGCHRR